jgi:hypothetical protein
MFWDPYKTPNARRAQCRIFERYTWWYVKKPLDFKRINTSAKTACLYETRYKYLAKGRQLYLPFSFLYNSDITPFAMCTTEIEAAMVQINVGSEILCDGVYFILCNEKQCHSGSAVFTSAFRLDVSNGFDNSCDGDMRNVITNPTYKSCIECEIFVLYITFSLLWMLRSEIMLTTRTLNYPSEFF